MLCRMNCVGTIAAWASLSGCSSIFLAPGYQAIHFLRHVLDELQGFLIELEIFMKGAAIRRSRPIAAHEKYGGSDRSLGTKEKISKDKGVGSNLSHSGRRVFHRNHITRRVAWPSTNSHDPTNRASLSLARSHALPPSITPP